MNSDRQFYIAAATRPPEQTDPSFAVGIGGLIVATLAFLGAWAFQTITAGYKEDTMDLRTRMDKLEANHTASCELFVRRDDYIRAMSSIDKKLDDMASRQDRQFQILLDKLIHSRGNDLN